MKTLDAFLTLDLVSAGQNSNEPLSTIHISTGNFITVSLSAKATRGVELNFIAQNSKLAISMRGESLSCRVRNMIPLTVVGHPTGNKFVLYCVFTPPITYLIHSIVQALDCIVYLSLLSVPVSLTHYWALAPLTAASQVLLSQYHHYQQERPQSR